MAIEQLIIDKIDTILPILIGWSLVVLVLKGLALWSAARYSRKGWFIALLVINTLGILEGIYLIFFRRKK